jgi:hypothetical protein
MVHNEYLIELLLKELLNRTVYFYCANPLFVVILPKLSS